MTPYTIAGERPLQRRLASLKRLAQTMQRSQTYVDLPEPSNEVAQAYAASSTSTDALMPTSDMTGPIHAIIGWIDTMSEKDAIETAKAYAESHFTAPLLCNYHVERNPGGAGGYFWEAAEGGHGRAYLPNVMKAIIAQRRTVWFRVRNRAFTIDPTGSKPSCNLQTAAQSQTWFHNPDTEIKPSRTKMQPVVWRGGPVLTAGVFTALAGLAFFMVATVISTRSINSLPEPLKLDAASLPANQLESMQKIPLTQYIAALRYANGHWQAPVLRTIARFVPAAGDPLAVPPAAGGSPARPAATQHAGWQAPDDDAAPRSSLPDPNAILSPSRHALPHGPGPRR